MKKEDFTPIHLRTLPNDPIAYNGVETFNHPEFFEFLFKFLRPQNYLELGVRHGETFTKVAKYCTNAIGVDTENIRSLGNGLNNVNFHIMTTDDYFDQLEPDEMFDFVFIDADHSYEQSLKDFINVKDRVIEDGFIFFHDSYPIKEEYAIPGACEEVYKTILYIKENFINEFEVLTIPVSPGVTMVKKMPINKQLIYK